MTCVIGYIDKPTNTSYMACDTLASSDSDRLVFNNPKTYKYCKKMTFGFAGSYRFSQVFMNTFGYDIFNIPNWNVDFFTERLFKQHMSTNFIKFVRNIIVQENFNNSDNQMQSHTKTDKIYKNMSEICDDYINPPFRFPFELMCVYSDKIYILEPDYAFIELGSNFACIGSGYKYALPLLDHIVSHDLNSVEFKSIVERKAYIKVKLAEVIKTVSKYSNYVGDQSIILENDII